MSDSCGHHGCAPPAATQSPRYRRVLWAALVINAAMFAIEIAGGLRAGSVSLLADAVDFVGAAANYGISLLVLGMALTWRARAALLKGLSLDACGPSSSAVPRAWSSSRPGSNCARCRRSQASNADGTNASSGMQRAATSHASAPRSGETPPPGCLAHAGQNPVAARLSPCVASSPFFSLPCFRSSSAGRRWHRIASTRPKVPAHFDHHEHPHHADVGPHADPVADADDDGDKASGAMDLDCGHCHGQCSVMLTLSAKPPGSISTAPPSTTLDETGSAHAPARPERPQWLPLA